MSLCINPHCSQPNHPDNGGSPTCVVCGSGLVLQGRYRVMRLISSDSAFGRVYEAYERNVPKILKVLKEGYNTNDKVVELFRREAQVLSQLNHPGVPRVEPEGYFLYYPKDSPTGSTGSLHCLIMEKIEGPNLKQWMVQQGNHPISEKQAMLWLTQLTDVLDLVHQHNYFHCGIKPENIMLRPSGQLVLVDFGSAREMTQTYMANLGDSGITTVSSAGYTPPEQEQGQAVPQSDFYALGRTLIYLMTAKLPNDTTIYNSRTNAFTWRPLAPQISAPLADLVDDLIAPAAAHRPQSTAVILERLVKTREERLVKTRGENTSTQAAPKSTFLNISMKPLLGPFYIEEELETYAEISLSKANQNDDLEAADWPSKVGKFLGNLVNRNHSQKLSKERILRENFLEINLLQNGYAKEDINLFLTSSSLQVKDRSEASFPISSDFLENGYQEIRFHLTPLRAGRSEIFLEIYLNEEFKGKIRQFVDIKSRDKNRGIKNQAISSRPVPHPDLRLQVQGLNNANSNFQLSCQLVNFTLPVAFDEFSSLSKTFQVRLIDKFRRELSLIAERNYSEGSQAKEQLAALEQIGQALFQLLLPQDIQDELRSVRHFSRPASLMILADQATWLPWEIMHDGQHFLGDRFILGRWPLEISDKRPYEFAIGSVKLAHYADVERPEMWLDLLEPPGLMPPSVMQQGIFEDPGLVEVLQGLHLVRQGERDKDLDERIDAPVAIQETRTAEGVEEQLQPGKLNLRRNRPIVSLGYLQNGHKELTNIETAWVPAFLRAGCSAFVGSLWSVRPEVEAAFISNFYSNLWAGNNLGLAFYKAKQMARVAVPESVDWLAYVLYGDPMARPYRPVEGRGYAVVETVGHNLDQPVAAGSTLRFRASLRRKPPIWYENRLMDVTEALNFDDLKVYIAASGIEVKPSDCIQMRRTPDGDYLGWFKLSIPSELAGQTILVQVHFEDGDDPIQSQRLTLKVAEA